MFQCKFQFSFSAKLIDCLTQLLAWYRTRGSANSVRLYTMHASDTGVSRMLLWWMWKMGVNAVNDIFHPTPVKPESAAAKASTKVKTMFEGDFP